MLEGILGTTRVINIQNYRRYLVYYKPDKITILLRIHKHTYNASDLTHVDLCNEIKNTHAQTQIPVNPRLVPQPNLRHMIRMIPSGHGLVTNGACP